MCPSNRRTLHVVSYKCQNQFIHSIEKSSLIQDTNFCFLQFLIKAVLYVSYWQTALTSNVLHKIWKNKCCCNWHLISFPKEINQMFIQTNIFSASYVILCDYFCFPCQSAMQILSRGCILNILKFSTLSNIMNATVSIYRCVRQIVMSCKIKYAGCFNKCPFYSYKLSNYLSCFCYIDSYRQKNN